jgi:predicted nucleic acid-binding protein
LILLHSSVLGKAISSTEQAAIVAWLDKQLSSDLHLSTVTIAVVSIALSTAPLFGRKPDLLQRLDELLQGLFADRVIELTGDQALAAGRHQATAARRGHKLDLENSALAAIAGMSRLTVATLDPEPLIAAGVRAINPLQGKDAKPRPARAVRAKRSRSAAPESPP